MCTTNDGETDCASFLGLGDLLCCAGRGLALSSRTAEFLGIGENQIHMLFTNLGKPTTTGFGCILYQKRASALPFVCHLEG